MPSFREKSVLIIHNYLNAGIKPETNIEVARKINVLNLFAFVGFSITALLGLRAALDSQWPLALALFLASALILSSHLVNRFSQSSRAYYFGSLLLQIVLMILCLYLVYGGGKNNTGPLWIFLVPPVVMFFSGIKNGIIAITIFVVIYCSIVFIPRSFLMPVEYSYEFKTRLLYSFLTLTFLAGFYEYSRQASYQKFIELTNKLELQATLDPLTKLLNRRGMLERIDYEVDRSLRNKNSLSFILADVDHFKQINDQYGHDMGDTALSTMSELFLDTIRKQDSVSRWGGEEFLFLLPDTNIDQAKTLAEKIRSIVEKVKFEHQGKHLNITLSFGVAEVEDLQHARNIIRKADARLYAAKDQGRNCVVASDK